MIAGISRIVSGERFFRQRGWDRWPCTHAATLFFRIRPQHVEAHVPSGLEPWVDSDGWAMIELGYVRFPSQPSQGDLPPSEELAWAIRVRRRRGFGMAYFAMNIAGSNEPFLERVRADGFRVHAEPVEFDTDLWRGEVAMTDKQGRPLCHLRYRLDGTLPLPIFPGTTEVWTGEADALYSRSFYWEGMARVGLAPQVAATLCDHPFFGGVPVSKADPLPVQLLASRPIASGAAQWFGPRRRQR